MEEEREALREEAPSLGEAVRKILARALDRSVLAEFEGEEEKT